MHRVAKVDELPMRLTGVQVSSMPSSNGDPTVVTHPLACPTSRKGQPGWAVLGTCVNTKRRVPSTLHPWHAPREPQDPKSVVRSPALLELLLLELLLLLLLHVFIT